MSHIMNVRFDKDDRFLFSAGGLDCCTFQWKVLRNTGDNGDTKRPMPQPLKPGNGPQVLNAAQPLSLQSDDLLEGDDGIENTDA